MNETEITDALRAHVALLTGQDAGQISPARPLHEMGLDSMGFVDLLIFIEKRFNLPLAGSKLAREDFGSLEVLARRIAGATPPP